MRIPPAFRKLLGEKPVIFREGHCLQIYIKEDFEKRIESRFADADVFDEEMNKRKRKIFPSVQTVVEDKQGRVSVNPSFLKDCRMKKDIISIGVFDHVEIWAEDMYDAYINDRPFPTDDDEKKAEKPEKDDDKKASE